MQKFAPIALFVYNRPEHTRRTLQFLRQNQLAAESRLFIFSDGPKHPGQLENVKAVRELISQAEGFKSVEIIERTENMGLANSVISGVSQLVKAYGRVIVFEDDLITSPYTLRYFNEALDRYETEDRVMHIGAYMYPLPASSANTLPETFFFRVSSSWGWATWDRAWKHFNPDIDSLIQQFDPQKKYQFSIEGCMNFWKQMREFKSGKNNSWAIRWYASIFLRDGLSLNPAFSLINNIGHDGTGVHSGKNTMYSVNISQQQVSKFPDQITEHPEAYTFIKNFLKHRKGNLLQRIVRFILEKI